ncbi:MAG: DUF4401 domain-containing protein [Vreelandella alkaliphila]|uniref:DUF4401 domain-containing protein n=1 Tax=Halomonas campaniensis TaxID=213554 RepID=A0A3D0KBV1_9GAMM|nr:MULTISPECIES: DUF4401 domain-containing protein [unclassified Halomonas]WKD29178.1 DUF4401 domain-containing protein [Halomonas sp. KG2]HBP42009.1 DUF4401 domain-containing protein [Halomonas sp.]HBS83443.1 DUF4401 domain-containing protein [Halomonas campaniensis]HCA00845.1 DUF4401 domain-containing protein [Halomonas campaniensis]
MSQSMSTLKQRLTQAGIALNEPSSTTPLESPWFVRVLQAFSGWLAALFLLGFIATAVVFVLESSVASLVVGSLLIGGAFALLRAARSDVLEHMALAFSLAGQLLVAWPAVEMWGVSASLWWVLLALQCSLALIMPSQVHRSMSAFLASLALTMALAANGLAPVAIGMVVLVLTLLWLNECRWPGRIGAVQAWGAGLLMGVLVLQGQAYSNQLAWLYDSDAQWFDPWLASWLSTALVALALVCVIHQAFRQHSQPAIVQRLVIYGAVALVAVVSVYMPGLGAGVTVLLLGFTLGHRVLMGSGILLLLMAASNYYYWLEVTLLMKSLMLLAMGALLLSIRWGLKRWWLNRWLTVHKPMPLGDANEP